MTASIPSVSLQHSANLDLLRAVAVTCVIVHHLALTVHDHMGLLPLWTLDHFRALGHAGVLMFFVHTSMVLMESLDRLIRKEERPTAVFYIRRAFRIYPLAIVAILIAVVLHVPAKTWGTSDAGPTLRVILSNLLLIQNLVVKQQVLGPLWSLPYEVQMYVVLPLLHSIATRVRALRNLLLLYGGFCGIGLTLLHFTPRLNMFAYIPCFLCGVLCYAISRGRPVKRVPGALWVPFLLCAVACFITPIRFGEEATDWSGWLLCLVLGCIIPFVRDVRSRWLGTSGQQVAQYSYGVYLFHPVALWLMFMKLPAGNVSLRVTAFLLLTALFAVAGYHLIELPFIQLGKRFHAARRSRIVLRDQPSGS